MYHVIFCILLLFSTYEFFSPYKKGSGIVLFLLLYFFVTLRYGQGSDYFSYIYLFNNSANEFDIALTTYDFKYVTQEIGFAALSYLWLKILNLSPEALSALFSAISFILTWLFIKKYSHKPIISLFIFYCNFYLIYPFSGIRQGICISIFIYYLIPLLYNKKYIKYYLLSILLCTIHYSSIILFIIPVVNLVKEYKPLHVYITVIVALCIGLVLSKVLFSFFSTLDIIGGKVEGYTKEKSFDILSLLLRVTIFVPVMLTYKLYERNSIRDLFLKIYIMGFFLYLIFMGSSLISSRITVFMRYFELILLVDFLLFAFKKSTNKIISFSCIFAIMTVLYVKNINSFIDQGPYYNNINFFNYPYVSIFNKKKITEVRYVAPFFQQFLIYE